MTLYYPTTSNFIQKNLDAQLLTGITASATLNNVTSIQNKAGIMIIDRVDTNGVETPSKVEVISFAGTSGSTVTTLVRGLGGTTDQDHEVGAIVEFGPDIVWAQGLIDTMLVQHNEDGTHKSALVTTLKASGAEVTAGTEDAKIVTPKAIADSDIPTAKATAAEVATGTDDAKYTTALAVAPYANSSMARQAIINGNFDVWQRGTTYTGIATGSFLTDRFSLSHSADSGTFPTHINRRTAITAGEIPNSFYSYELNVNGAGTSLGAGSYYWIRQKIENGVRYLCGDGKKVTLSFWAKSDIANKRLGVHMRQDYGTGGSPTTAEVINGTNWTLTSTWTKYTHTFTTNTLSGKTFGTGDNDNIDLQFMHVWAATYKDRAGATTDESFVGAGSIFIAQVQLCAGDVALPFQPKRFEEELRACKRYYQKSFDYTVAPAQNSGSYLGALFYRALVAGATVHSMTVPYEVELRTAATPTFYNVAAANTKWRNATDNGDSGTPAQYDSSVKCMHVQNPGVATDAVGEALYLHWTVDAEL